MTIDLQLCKRSRDAPLVIDTTRLTLEEAPQKVFLQIEREWSIG